MKDENLHIEFKCGAQNSNIPNGMEPLLRCLFERAGLTGHYRFTGGNQPKTHGGGRKGVHGVTLRAGTDEKSFKLSAQPDDNGTFRQFIVYPPAANAASVIEALETVISESGSAEESLDIDFYREMVDEEEAAVVKATTEVGDIQARLAEARLQLKKWEGKEADAKAQLGQFNKTKLAPADERQKAAQEALDEAQARFDEASQQFMQVRVEQRSLAQAVHDARAEVEAIRQSIDTEDGRLRWASTRLASAQTSLESAQRELEVEQEALVKRRVDALAAGGVDLEKLIAELQARQGGEKA